MPSTRFYLPRERSSVLQHLRGTNCSCSEAPTQIPSSEGKCQELLRCEAPMECSPTIQTIHQHSFGFRSTRRSQLCIFLSVHLGQLDPKWKSESFHPFIFILARMWYKIPEQISARKNLHLYSNASECGLQKYFRSFFKVWETFSQFSNLLNLTTAG